MTLPKSTMSSSSSGWSDSSEDSVNSKVRERLIIVANFLPILHNISNETGKLFFQWNEDSLLLLLKDGISTGTEVVYVGRLEIDIDHNEQEEVAQKLFNDFKCIPTFLPHDIEKKFYHGFCKQQLWPLFHYKLPIFLNNCELFDPSLFRAYVTANNFFADRVMEAIRTEYDSIWIHDYHLMLLPTFIRKKVNQIKLGFFLHIPFPSSEIYHALPKREEVLRGLLNADLIGFHTFEYARHFLSCCSRMLGLDFECNRGYVGVKYCGRTVSIKILPVGVHIGQIQSMLNLPITMSRVKEIEQKFKGKKLILGVDDMDIFKGITLKLEGLELLLKRNPSLIGKIVLVQIINAARSSEKDVSETRTKVTSIAERINIAFGFPGYKPVLLLKSTIPTYGKIAFYVAADCCIANAFRDGMNLIPYEYVVCRQGTEEMDKARGIQQNSPHTSTLIVSKFIECSSSLSGAFRVNPWSVEEVAEALYHSVIMPESENQSRHKKHYRYISSHDVAYWSSSFINDLERACKDHYNRTYWPLGLGLNFRVLALDHGFQKLSMSRICSSYQLANKRAIFLDYDGTLVPDTSISKLPRMTLISILNKLSSNLKNTVFIVSGRDRSSLGKWLSPCESLGIAAEHGFFIRWNKESDWESSPIPVNFEWKKIAEPVMKLYTETTDGSSIESKESALVWHYQHADPYFGSCQANELLDHLESMLSNEPVAVRKGDHIVEVKPQGVSKGMVVEKLLQKLVSEGRAPDFVLCIGDDKSDEDIFGRDL